MTFKIHFYPFYSFFHHSTLLITLSDFHIRREQYSLFCFCLPSGPFGRLNIPAQANHPSVNDSCSHRVKVNIPQMQNNASDAFF